MVRAGLYIRVSTEEQVLHGYSLEAQRTALTKYAREHSMYIVDYYVDEGKSARKSYKSRPEFIRLLHDVEQDKLDLILFIKLDRWFRSVKDYYKVQEILDAHKVQWKTTEEEYDTTTKGRLYTNIRLSLAQDKSDRLGDRIRFALAAKKRRHEWLVGSPPLGYKVESKHLIPDPEKADMMRDFFHYYAEHWNKSGLIRYLFQTCRKKMNRCSVGRILHNPVYKGEYQGIPGYCEPLIEPELFDRINARPGIRATPRKRVYLFSGLIRCSLCNARMSGQLTNKKEKAYIYYTCSNYTNYKDCTHYRSMSETKLEAWLLEHLEGAIRDFLVFYESETPQKKPNRAAILRKLERLKDLYVDEIIDKKAYRADYERYMLQLSELPEPEKKTTANIQALKDFLTSDFRSYYGDLSREEQRILWHKVIQEIRIDAENNISLLFG